VGHYVAGTRPEDAARTLASIETASRTAMGEMRRLLGVLRDDRTGPELAPAPGLADVGRLITGTADAGVRVQLEVRGARCGVPPGVDLAAYRIVQEALTNVVKHARASSAWVKVAADGERCTVEVRDDGIGGAQARSDSSGLTGLRDRIGALNGVMNIVAPAEGGTVLNAAIPLPREPTGEAGLMP
jgi:signal transduction histidine kinase